MATQYNNQVYLCTTYGTMLPNKSIVLDKFAKCVLYENINTADTVHFMNINSQSGFYHLVHSQIHPVYNFIPMIIQKQIIKSKYPIKKPIIFS